MTNKPTRAILSLIIVAIAIVSASAAPPSVNGLFPPGLQLGTTKTLDVLGSSGSGTPRVWVSDKRVKMEPTKKGKLKVTVAKNATPGLVWFRLANSEGASEMRPIVLGSVAESIEKEPNNAVSQAHSLVLPHVVSGKLGSGDVDGYRVALKKGETMVAEVTANHLLAFEMDGVLQICNDEGIVLAQTDDTRGYDPMLIFSAPASGNYLVRVFAFPVKPNSSIAYAGGSNYIYRLTLTHRGYLDHAFPLAVSALQKKVTLKLFGWNLPVNSKQFELAKSARSTVVFHTAASSFVELPVVACPTMVAAPDCSVSKPQKLAVPVVVSGRIGKHREEHAFLLACKKNQRIHLQVEARQIGYELDPYVRVFDSKKNRIALLDDTGGRRDIKASFVVKAAGTYRLQIRDAHQHGGFRFVYRMTLKPDTKDFDLELKTHILAVPVSGTASVEVTVNRSGGYKQPIQIDALGLPPGITAKQVVSPAKGATAKKVKLVFSAKGKPGSGGPIQIRGKSGSLERVASFTVLSHRQRDFWVYSVAAKKKKKKK